MNEIIYEIITTIFLLIGFGGWSFVCVWLGYISGKDKGFDEGYYRGVQRERSKRVKDKIKLKYKTDVTTTYKGKPLKYAKNGLHNRLKGENNEI